MFIRLFLLLFALPLVVDVVVLALHDFRQHVIPSNLPRPRIRLFVLSHVKERIIRWDMDDVRYTRAHNTLANNQKESARHRKREGERKKVRDTDRKADRETDRKIM